MGRLINTTTQFRLKAGTKWERRKISKDSLSSNLVPRAKKLLQHGLQDWCDLKIGSPTVREKGVVSGCLVYPKQSSEPCGCQSSPPRRRRRQIQSRTRFAR